MRRSGSIHNFKIAVYANCVNESENGFSQGVTKDVIYLG